MRKSFILAGILSAFVASGAMADLLYFQSFENEDWLGSQYHDTQDPLTDHWLFNNEGEAAVNGDGFNAYYTNTRDSSGLFDGDYFGVTTYTGGGVGSWVDGDQGYQMQDTDGMVSLIFDDYGSGVDVSLWILISSTGWESNDLIQISYGGTSLLDSYGLDIDDMGVEGVWMELSASNVSGQLTISLDSNASTEQLFIDMITISGAAIPAPGALVLLGLVGLVSRRRRK